MKEIAGSAIIDLWLCIEHTLTHCCEWLVGQKWLILAEEFESSYFTVYERSVPGHYVINIHAYTKTKTKYLRPFVISGGHSSMSPIWDSGSPMSIRPHLRKRQIHASWSRVSRSSDMEECELPLAENSEVAVPEEEMSSDVWRTGPEVLLTTHVLSINNIIIIITRPKPAYGRQGLAGVPFWWS